MIINTINIIRSLGKSNPYILICNQNAEPSAQTSIIIYYIYYVTKLILKILTKINNKIKVIKMLYYQD